MLSAFERAFIQRFDALDRTDLFYTTRQKAIEDFKQQGLPTPKEETYKYTPITNLLEAHLNLRSSFTTAQTTAVSCTPYQNLDAYQLVLLNGQISDQHKLLGGHEQFMQLMTFREAHQQPAFLVHFTQHAPSEKDPFLALNTALFEEGLFIHIADHAVLNKPLIIYHCTDPGKHQALTYPRLLIVAGQNSQASIINVWQTTNFTNVVAEIAIGSAARLDYYNLQTQLGQHTYQVHHTHCCQALQSTLNTYAFTWSGALVRNNLTSLLDASHSQVNMYGLYCLYDQQHVDNFTTVDHLKPHTYSQELYKGVMMGASTGVFNGRIYVRPEAQKTRAFQANNNLVLSKQATLHTKPQLEIWADDVKCSHGATTGQLDKEQLFYLRTRGIQNNEAKFMLRQAFVNEVFNKIPLKALRTQLQESWVTQEKRAMK